MTLRLIAITERLGAAASGASLDAGGSLAGLPERNASNRILEKLGFEFAGEVEHPEDGTVWEWSVEL